jgi:alpha-methylacyl-CoA racemase
MTGWGQDGPLAHSAGHDLTYVATCGVLHGLGQDEGKPQFPMNLLGDFGGGSTFLVIGVLAALVHARVSGAGQVVDAAIVDGTAYLDLLTAGFRAAGEHSDPRGSNLLDGGAPFYQLYRTADDRWMAVGAIEPQFFRELVHRLGLEGSVPGQYETERYAEMRALFETAFAQKTMAEWSELFEGTDSCVAPVLTPAESSGHRHMAARGTYVTVGGIVQPAAAPRFSGTSLPTPRLLGNAMIGDVLKRWGIAD